MINININKLPATPYSTTRESYDCYVMARIKHITLQRDELRQELKAADDLIADLENTITTLLQTLEG